jgi:CRP-like cAMP-binding protein
MSGNVQPTFLEVLSTPQSRCRVIYFFGRRMIGGAVSSHLKNKLLARLDSSTFALLEGELKEVRLNQGDVISESHTTVQRVFFPQGGVISCVVELVGGGAIETGMIGCDGQYGAGPALDHRVSPNLVVMQVAGDVSVIDASRFRDLANHNQGLRELAISYDQFFLAQIQQTAACNAVHNVQARACKWLLRMHRLVGDELPLTQEFLAQMMGVRRTSVTEVAGDLQRAGMITYSRGRIHLLDVGKIRQYACECDDAVNSHYDRILAPQLVAKPAD